MFFDLLSGHRMDAEASSLQKRLEGMKESREASDKGEARTLEVSIWVYMKVFALICCVNLWCLMVNQALRDLFFLTFFFIKLLILSRAQNGYVWYDAKLQHVFWGFHLVLINNLYWNKSDIWNILSLSLSHTGARMHNHPGIQRNTCICFLLHYGASCICQLNTHLSIPIKWRCMKLGAISHMRNL